MTVQYASVEIGGSVIDVLHGRQFIHDTQRRCSRFIDFDAVQCLAGAHGRFITQQSRGRKSAHDVMSDHTRDIQREYGVESGEKVP